MTVEERKDHVQRLRASSFVTENTVKILTKLWDPHTRWRKEKVAMIEIQFCHLYNINCEHSIDATRGLAK